MGISPVDTLLSESVDSERLKGSSTARTNSGKSNMFTLYNNWKKELQY